MTAGDVRGRDPRSWARRAGGRARALLPRREDLTAPRVDQARFDLVCCRNLLIFLGREGQRRVLDTARRALRPGGVLALGRTESLVALPDAGLEPVDLTHRLYRGAA